MKSLREAVAEWLADEHLWAYEYPSIIIKHLLDPRGVGLALEMREDEVEDWPIEDREDAESLREEVDGADASVCRKALEDYLAARVAK